MKRWRFVKIVAVTAGFLLTAVLVARLGPHTIVEEIDKAGAGALWLLATYLVGTAIGGLPWYVLLGDTARPSLRAAVVSRIAASGANSVLPLGVGGEPVRLLWLAPRDRAVGLAGIVVDRLTYAAGSAVFLFIGAIAAVRIARLPRIYVIAAIAAGVVLVVASGLVVWLAVRHRISGRIERVIGRIRRRTVPDEGFGDEVDRALAELLRRRRRIVVAIALSALARVVLGLEVYAGFRVLGIALSVDDALVFAAVPVVLSFVGVIVPNQLGVQESSQALLASALGISAPAAVAVVLLQRIRQVVTAAIAMIAIALARRSQPSGEPDPAPS